MRVWTAKRRITRILEVADAGARCLGLPLGRSFRCKDVSLTYMAESMTPMQCMMASPSEIAKWAEGNPKWFAKKWSCRPAGRVAKI